MSSFVPRWVMPSFQQCPQHSTSQLKSHEVCPGGRLATALPPVLRGASSGTLGRSAAAAEPVPSRGRCVQQADTWQDGFDSGNPKSRENSGLFKLRRFMFFPQVRKVTCLCSICLPLKAPGNS